MDNEQLPTRDMNAQETPQNMPNIPPPMQGNGMDSTNQWAYANTGYMPAGQQQSPLPYPTNTVAPPTKKKKTGLVITIVAVALVVVAALVFFLLQNGTRAEKDLFSQQKPRLYVRENDTLMLNWDGTSKTLDIAPKSVSSNQTGSQVVYLNEDGTVHLLEVQSGKDTVLSEDASQLSGFVMEQYVLFAKGGSEPDEVLLAIANYAGLSSEEIRAFMDENEIAYTLGNLMDLYKEVTTETFETSKRTTHLYHLQNGKETELALMLSDESSDSNTLRSSSDNKQLAYVDKDGIICLMDAKGTVTQVGEVSVNAKTDLLGVPDKGSLVVWGTTRDDTTTVFAYVGGNEKEIFRTDENKYIQNDYNPANDTVLIYGYYWDTMYEVKNNGDLNEIEFYGSDSMLVYYPEPGYRPKNIDTFYVEANNTQGNSLYLIDKARKKHKVSTTAKWITDIQVRANSVYYIDNDDVLYDIKTKDIASGKSGKIASDVSKTYASLDGNILWYTKGDLNEGTLFRYMNGESEKIEENCEICDISPDGQTVLYFKNLVSPDEEKYSYFGELYMWENGKATLIAENVITSSVYSSSSAASYINPLCFTFYQNSRYENGKFYGDASYYSKGEIITIIKDEEW